MMVETNGNSKKCGVLIKRESKLSFSARNFHILVDGNRVASIKNGEVKRLLLEPGNHEISFAIGKREKSHILLDLKKDDEDVSVICHASGNGVKAKFTPVDIRSLEVTARNRHHSSGRWIGILLLVLLLIILYYGITITFRVDFFLLPSN